MFSAQNPVGCDSVASVGCVAASSDTEGFPKPALEARPEADPLEDRVEELGDHTVMGRLRVRVVDCVMFGTLEDSQVVEKVYPGTVLAAAAVRPFVDLVRVARKECEDPDGGCEGSEDPDGGEDQAGDEPEVPTGGYPRFFEKMAGSVVVENVGAGDEFTQDRAVVPEVGVFDPVEHADDEIGSEDSYRGARDCSGDVDGPKYGVAHDSAVVARWVGFA